MACWTLAVLANRLPWVSIAPLGLPVVPEVYRMAARSSAGSNLMAAAENPCSESPAMACRLSSCPMPRTPGWSQTLAETPLARRTRHDGASLWPRVLQDEGHFVPADEEVEGTTVAPALTIPGRRRRKKHSSCSTARRGRPWPLLFRPTRRRGRRTADQAAIIQSAIGETTAGRPDIAVPLPKGVGERLHVGLHSRQT